MERKYTSEMETVMDNMAEISKNHAIGDNKITPLHLILSILDSQDSIGYSIIYNKISSQIIGKIKSIYEKMIGNNIATGETINSDELDEILKQASIKSKSRNSDLISSGDALLAVISNNFNTKNIFERFGITEHYVETLTSIAKPVHQIDNREEFIGNIPPEPIEENFIDKYTENINIQVNNGMYDKVIGRDKEIFKLATILGRRNKNNALIVGDTGIGKTSLVYKLADMINQGTAPSSLVGKVIYKLDVIALVSGTSFRGMLESRIKELFSQLSNCKNAILFIDDMQNIVKTSTKDKDTDISGVLGEILNDENVRVIGAIGYKDMKNGIENNPNISKKFYRLTLSSMSEKETIKTICENKHYYEDFHNIVVSDEIATKIVKYANRFITDSKLPNSAIDILDTIGAIAQIDNSEEVKTINENDVKEAVSEITGIPSNNLSSDELEKLRNIEDNLKENIIGQDTAIDTICNSIKRHSIGISDNSRPIAVSLLCGPTGVGKTLLAKKISKEMFGNENNIIRIDMSEFSEKSSISRLIGTSAGYIGFDSTNMLTDKVNENPYSLILLDEIEKANDEIFNLLLQVFDDGRLTDGRGNTVSFKNCIILMTSNIGARENSDYNGGIGFTDTSKTQSEEIYKKALKSKFSPEFINRIDNVIYFNSLGSNEIKKIISLELNYLQKRLKDNLDIELTYDSKIIDDYIFNGIKEESEFGARPIKRFISSSIESKITDKLLSDTDNIKSLTLSCNKDKELIIS